LVVAEVDLVSEHLVDHHDLPTPGRWKHVVSERPVLVMLARPLPVLDVLVAQRCEEKPCKDEVTRPNIRPGRRHERHVGPKSQLPLDELAAPNNRKIGGLANLAPTDQVLELHTIVVAKRNCAIARDLDSVD